MGSIWEIYNSPNTFRVEHAEWEGNNKMRIARNNKEAASVALKEFTRSLVNQRVLAAAGEEYNTQMENLSRELDTTVNTDINFALAAESMKGQLAAQAAAAGVGGTSVELLDSVTNLHYEIQSDANARERDALALVGNRENADIIRKSIAELDNSRYFGNFDHSIQLEPKKLKNRWGAMIAVGVASYFGGPQAGQAVADTVMASHKAANGDYGAASEYYSNAVRNAGGAMQEWASLQDDSGKAKSWFQAVRDRNNASKQTLGSTQQFGSEDASSMGGWFGGF